MTAEPAGDRRAPRPDVRAAGTTAVLVGLAALAFYLATLAPSVGWGDAARLQLEVSQRGSTYWFLEQVQRPATDGWPFEFLGVAIWDHPLYVMLAQLVVAGLGGDPAWRVNVFSALAAAMAIAAFFRVSLAIADDRRAALLGSMALAVSHTFWFHAVTAEVYALHSLFMMALVGLTFAVDEGRGPAVGRVRALIAGVGAANHLMLGLTVVAILAWENWPHGEQAVGSRTPRSRLSTAEAFVWVACFLVGFAPWWIQCLRMAHAIGVGATLSTATGMPALGQRVLPPSIAGIGLNLLAYVGWLTYQFTPVGVFLGIWGAWRLRARDRHRFRLLAALFITHAAFSANYQVPDRFAFHQPSYIAFAWATVAGIDGALGRVDGRRGLRVGGRVLTTAAAALVVSAPLVAYALTVPTLLALGIDDAKLRIPSVGSSGGDRARYFLNPDHRGDRSASRFGRQTLQALEPSALVLAPKARDQEAYLVLRYFQLAEALRPDVELDMLLAEPAGQVADSIARRTVAESPCRPVYWVSLDADSYPIRALQSAFTFVPEANLYRVRPAVPASGTQPCGVGDRHAQPRVAIEDLVRSAMSTR